MAFAILTALLWVGSASGKGDAALTGAAAPASTEVRVVPTGSMDAFGTPRVWLNGVVAAADAVPVAMPSLPDPQSDKVVMWLAFGLAALVVFIGGVAGAGLTIWAVIDRIRGKQDRVSVEGEVHTRPSATGPTRIEFDMHVGAVADLRKERREDVVEIKAALKEIDGKLGTFSSSQYSARARMHQRLNTLENAMWFWAGKLAGSGDAQGAELQAILQRKPEPEADHS
jgi:hypothetical protein